MLPDEPLLSPYRIFTSVRFWWYFCRRDIDDACRQGRECPELEPTVIPFWATLYYHHRPELAELDGHPNWS